jgi:hypothetical protein
MPSQLIKEATPEGKKRRHRHKKARKWQALRAAADTSHGHTDVGSCVDDSGGDDGGAEAGKPTTTATIQKKHKSTTCRSATCAKGQRCPFVKEYGKPKKPPAATLVVEEGAGVCVLDFEFREKGNLVAARSAGATTSASVNGTRGRISRG